MVERGPWVMGMIFVTPEPNKGSATPLKLIGHLCLARPWQAGLGMPTWINIGSDRMLYVQFIFAHVTCTSSPKRTEAWTHAREHHITNFGLLFPFLARHHAPCEFPRLPPSRRAFVHGVLWLCDLCTKPHVRLGSHYECDQFRQETTIPSPSIIIFLNPRQATMKSSKPEHTRVSKSWAKFALVPHNESKPLQRCGSRAGWQAHGQGGEHGHGGEEGVEHLGCRDLPRLGGHDPASRCRPGQEEDATISPHRS